jgi:NDP-sugar pyrophosphorylase family protein
MLPVAILAGGLATRLRPLTETIPKALVEIHGEPFIAHQLRLLASRGAGEVVLCVGYRGEMIAEAVGDGAAFGLRVRYSYDGPRLRGTAGAVREALPLLGERFFVLYGDSYLPCDYAAVEQSFLHSGRPALMTVFGNEGRWDASNVEFRDGRILRYEKNRKDPAMRHIDYGLGVFERRAFEGIPEVYSLERLYQDLLRTGGLGACEVRERFYEIGSFEGIEELRRHLA